jgi:4-diphosphocytidyl-2-C-methyl-D-erythritol kinase
MGCAVSEQARISCLAPAKLNLFLHVVGRREDGYHLLQTVFRFLDYGDRLSFELRSDGDVIQRNPLLGVAQEHELCVRAARLLQHETGCRSGVDIVLDKVLPLGGGLGGGSSDAATTLLVLNRLWNLGLSRARLQQLALELGADVPVFVFGQSAFAEGIGEQLQRIVLPPAWYVVLTPPVHVSTPQVFASPELTRGTIPVKIAAFSPGQGHNDLEPVVCHAYPIVAEHLGWLKRYGDARMTGSGACVFAAFESEEQAAQVFAQRPSHMLGFVARGLDKHPLFDFAG